MIFRKAILLIHGFAGNSYDYGELYNELQYVSSFDVFTFVLPGHDKTFIASVTYNDWISAAEKRMEKLISVGYKNIYVVGHSMGGVIACHIANKYNKYVKKVVLAAPAFRYMYFKNGKIDVLTSLKKSPEIFGGLDMHTVVSRIFKVPITTAMQFTKLTDKYHDCPKNITVPILIIHGTNDKIVPIESCQYVHNSVKSRVNILLNIKGVNHDCFTGNRKEDVYTSVITFLKKKYVTEIKRTIDI